SQIYLKLLTNNKIRNLMLFFCEICGLEALLQLKNNGSGASGIALQSRALAPVKDLSFSTPN
ncbi:MAG: hypothetical protein RI575_13200, partial [Balneolaceae bacterium]|nr:hypothetical protein [Balneolaceae bacterium]